MTNRAWICTCKANTRSDFGSKPYTQSHYRWWFLCVHANSRMIIFLQQKYCMYDTFSCKLINLSNFTRSRGLDYPVISRYSVIHIYRDHIFIDRPCLRSFSIKLAIVISLTIINKLFLLVLNFCCQQNLKSKKLFHVWWIFNNKE